MKWRFGVIITCYNEEQYIGRAIDSVLKQTSPVDHIVVVNDGSTDGSEGIIESRREASKVPFEYLYQTNTGLPAARNLAIRHCSCEYIAILDGDDYWAENKVSSFKAEIEKYPGVGLFYSSFFKDFGTNLQLIRPRRYFADEGPPLMRFVANDGPIIPSVVVLKRECFDTVGYFDEEFLRGQDMELWYRVSAKYSFQYIDQPLTFKYERTDSLGTNTEKKSVYLYKALDKIQVMYPEVARIRKRRESRVEYTLGLYLFKVGRTNESFRALFKALQLYPLNFRALLLLLRVFWNRLSGF